MRFSTKALKGTLAEQKPEDGVNIAEHQKKVGYDKSKPFGNPFSPFLSRRHGSSIESLVLLTHKICLLPFEWPENPRNNNSLSNQYLQ